MEPIEAMQHVQDADKYLAFVRRVDARRRRGIVAAPPTVGAEDVEVAMPPVADPFVARSVVAQAGRSRQRKEYTEAVPARSLAQRMAALGRANEVRTCRAQLKRELKAGRASILDVLLEPPACVESAKVFDMLLAVPKYGRVKVNKVLQQVSISPSKTVGGMTQRQRAELVSLIRR